MAERQPRGVVCPQALGTEGYVLKAYETYIETRPPEVVANILICLINQTNYLLDKLLRHLEKAFVEAGRLRERTNRARLAHRDKQNRRGPT
jgi:four helix bundle suffix protein